MKSQFAVFLKRLIIFSLIVAFVAIAALYFIPDAYVSPALPWLFIFFVLFTAGVYSVLLKTTKNKFSTFFRYFMIATLGKLLLYLVIIVIYALLYRDDAVNFIISFFIAYLLFTAFEVVSVLKI
ncbi:MAG: hypothetical protein M0R21_07105 [Lentimicrobiaceae bacterium]|nr:hypothetical protein [Lentimicrobiaceae bacterium]